MAWLVVAIAAFCFGAGDQYLGSLEVTSRIGFWTISVSLLSAPWLLLPFAAGSSQTVRWKAAIIGLVATFAALAGYFLMIMGPFEGGAWDLTVREARGLIESNAANILGGLVTAPLYGVLGQQWRTRRSWISALFVSGALCLEPVAQMATGHTYPDSSLVWATEALLGAVATALLLAYAYQRRTLAGLRS